MTERKQDREGKSKGKDLSPKEIAKKSAEEYDEPKRRDLNMPGTGGDPEHRRSKQLDTDDTNSLTR